LLFAFAEQGIAGGALFGLGWLAAAIGLFAFIVRKEEDEPHATPTDRERQGFAFAGLALLAVSLFHAPLLYNFLAGPLVFFLLGIALKTTPTRFAASKSDGARNPALLVFAVLGLLASQVPNAWSLTKHNEALWPINGPYLDVGAKAALVRPDSFQANASAARRCDKRRARSVLAAESQSPELVAGGPDDSIPYWTAALRVRPHSIEALSNIGRVYASRGAFDEALVHWNHARELDPGYPVVLRNLRRLGADLVLSGKLDAGLRELAPHLSLEEAVDENGNPIDVGSNLLNESQRESDPLLASALLCAAQWTWAREHAAAGNFDYAVRSYRQARRELQREPLHSAPELDFEYGAALRLGGRQTEAADIWAALGDTQVLQSASPQWAAEAFDLD
jgi:tetratricopeptide (TPR) repeat protein